MVNNISNIKAGYSREEIMHNGIVTRYRVKLVSEQELNTNGYINKLAHVIHDNI